MNAEEVQKAIANLMKQFDNQSPGAEALLPILRDKVNTFKSSGQPMPPEVERAEKYLLSQAA